MLRRLLVSIIGLATVALSAGAQAASPRISALTTDSTAWQRVLYHVVSSLSTRLVQAAVDPSAQPWRIVLPAEDPQRALLAVQLQRVLRARTPTDADSVVFELSLGPLRIVRDTARVEFRSSVTRRCPGSARTTGWGNGEEIFVPRAPSGWWGAARSTSVMHGDRVGCPSPQ